VQDGFDFPAMLSGRGVRPQEMAHRGELVLIGHFGLCDFDGHRFLPCLTKQERRSAVGMAEAEGKEAGFPVRKLAKSASCFRQDDVLPREML
jgi:hypothetical protein